MFIKWFVTSAAHMWLGRKQQPPLLLSIISTFAIAFHEFSFTTHLCLFIIFYRPWGRICTTSIKVWRGAKIWQNSSENLLVVFESMWHSNSRRILYEHFHVASTENLHRRLASELDRHRRWLFWCELENGFKVSGISNAEILNGKTLICVEVSKDYSWKSLKLSFCWKLRKLHFYWKLLSSSFGESLKSS